MGLIGDIRARATQQTLSYVETVDGTAQKTYVDGSGNISAVDVLVDGQVQPLVQVPNSSGLKIAVGMKVKVNFNKGSRNDPQVIGGSGAATGGAIAAAAAAQGAAQTPQTSALAGYPFLLEEADEQIPDGYVLMPGANVLVVGTTGITTPGITETYNSFTVSAQPLVGASLPLVTTPGLLDGVCLDLMDSYGSPLGMYRFDGANAVWRRRDAAGVATVFSGPAQSAGFVPSAPLVPTGISQVISYNGLMMNVEAVPAFYGPDPAPSAPFVYWQKSLDGKDNSDPTKAWFGNDGTVNSTFPGSILQHTLGAGSAVRFRVRTENALGAISGWFAQAADTVYAAPAVSLQKRRFRVRMQSLSSTADTSPNLSMEDVLPFDTGEASCQWKLMAAYFRTDPPNAATTTAQLFYSSAGSAAFGAGTACFSSALSDSSSTDESSTTSFTGTLATDGLPSGTWLAPEFSGPGILFTSWEQV